MYLLAGRNAIVIEQADTVQSLRSLYTGTDSSAAAVIKAAAIRTGASYFNLFINLIDFGYLVEGAILVSVSNYKPVRDLMGLVDLPATCELPRISLRK